MASTKHWVVFKNTVLECPGQVSRRNIRGAQYRRRAFRKSDESLFFVGRLAWIPS